MPRNAKLHLTIGIVTFAAAVFMVFVESISYYEIRYGRDLVFIGNSKYLLAGALVSASAGFLLTARKRIAKQVPLVGSSTNMVAFSVAMVLAILAYGSEVGVFGEQ